LTTPATFMVRADVLPIRRNTAMLSAACASRCRRLRGQHQRGGSLLCPQEVHLKSQMLTLPLLLKTCNPFLALHPCLTKSSNG
jgi:hypothetical protein